MFNLLILNFTVKKLYCYKCFLVLFISDLLYPVQIVDHFSVHSRFVSSTTSIPPADDPQQCCSPSHMGDHGTTTVPLATVHSALQESWREICLILYNKKRREWWVVPAQNIPDVNLSGPYTCFSMQLAMSRIGTLADCILLEYPPLAWPVLPQPATWLLNMIHCLQNLPDIVALVPVA